MIRATIAALVGAALSFALTHPASADLACRKGQSFEAWIASVRAEAARAGASATALAALDNVRFDPGILAHDRGQPSLSASFLQYADRMVTAGRLRAGRAVLGKHAAVFEKAERTFGVPGPVVAAFWGLETDFGANIGKFPTLVSLATLGYDCRRPELFRGELMAALRILSAGDLAPDEMRGAWAGELGQFQFLPSHYLRLAVDFDGDGRRDLVRSVPDVLGSAARLVRELGWRPGEPWLREVRLPAGFAWQEAYLANKRPVADWLRAGVTAADGGRIDPGGPPAAILLPMGRTGPAFLAYRNFDVYWAWNQSSNYTLTAAYFATRLAGAPPMRRGAPPQPLPPRELAALQTILNRSGYDAGAADGRLGEATRAGVRRAQLALGLPADGYPTAELLARLRAR
ncbi:lytic murein transglycosylase [Propylenella binzhouense]|uniref:Lytic murein transglycosylase n=1 Tax=Propylenella binzhouense TaxID=2555902 RepID=A0A964WUF8_9HYPH|nr:lytic murein transglycosylase [Propylenella binzhouense]MYZ48800.1 lytic murein transglycosylase [Propylenella binzhouense]